MGPLVSVPRDRRGPAAGEDLALFAPSPLPHATPGQVPGELGPDPQGPMGSSPPTNLGAIQLGRGLCSLGPPLEVCKGMLLAASQLW